MSLHSSVSTHDLCTTILSKQIRNHTSDGQSELERTWTQPEESLLTQQPEADSCR